MSIIIIIIIIPFSVVYFRTINLSSIHLYQHVD